MANYPIAHIEIPAPNAGEASAFYSTVFGWQITTNQEYNYVIFQSEGGLRGGFKDPSEETYQLDRLLVYLTTDDIEATLASIEAHGGKTIQPQTAIPGGWWAIFTDPAGNHLGLFKSSRPNS